MAMLLHAEKQEFPYRKQIFFLFVLGFMAIPMFLDLPTWMGIGIIAMGLLTGALVRSFMLMEIEISDTELRFGFWVSTKKLPLPTIQEIEVVEISKLAGIGIHRYRGYWVYNARFSRGLRVQATGGKYMIGSEQPEQLHSVLRTALSRRMES